MSQDIEIERRLAAVLAADVAGFSRLTEADEVGTMRMLVAQRAILDAAVARHRGRIANTAGDSVLAEFPSAVNAVQCAVEAQEALRDAAEGAPEDKRVLFRVGIHVGDVMVRGGDLLGNGVNVAARLEALADAGGIVLSAAAHDQVRRILPLAYTDLGPQSVKNIDEPVRAFTIGPAPAGTSSPGGGKPLSLPDKPSIAVLAFQNMSGDPEQEYFADGMADEILTALSRFRELFVIARTSSFTYKGKSVDVRQIGRELGVRYVLEGSVRKAGGRVRITGQLIDATSGVQVWSDRIEGEHDDIFNLQDRAASAVVNAVAPKVEQVEIARAVAKATDSLDAYDLFMRAQACIYRWGRSDLEQAESLLARTIELDPKFAAAYANATWCLAWRLVNFWTDDLATDAARCGVLARQAVDLAPDDANVLSLAGFSLAQVAGALDEGIALINRAVSLNPNLARAWALSAAVHIFIGQPETAIEHNERAMRLSPRDIILHLMMHTTARAYFYAGRLDEAIAWSTRAMRESPHGHDGSMLHLIASYALTQRQEEATVALARYLAIHPQARLSGLWQLSRLRSPDHVAKLKEGLRLAGMPE
ncbi:MAG: adenylate/guanylate cyclase domain-containing protein [Bradyrhizobium sp.]|uniref:adenylate/guanylate cyclase domain-containing protein n=1 Tax=Bradyrhizobium sp. TaxID=376 RepID=UPI003D0E4331